MQAGETRSLPLARFATLLATSIKPGVPHEVFNMSTEPVVVFCRTLVRRRMG